MKKIIALLSLAMTSQTFAAQLVCNYYGEIVTAQWTSVEKLENVTVAEEGETDPDLISKFAVVVGEAAPRANANIFLFDLDGHGSERKLYLPKEITLGTFEATVMIYEDGVSPLKESATCNVQ